MKYSLSLLETQLQEIQDAFKKANGDERAAYLFCSLSSTLNEKRLIVSEVEIVSNEDIRSSSPVHLSVASRSFIRAMAKVDREKKSLIWVHSHPGGFSKFSEQDDNEEKDFFRTAYIRAPEGLHGSLIVIGSDPTLVGRVWLDENTFIHFDRIRVIGNRIKLYDYDHENEVMKTPEWADRQVLVFGEKAQTWLSTLHIGVVGVGGTGSAVSEQLIRLGIKKMTVIDDDTLENTNVTRLYGFDVTKFYLETLIDLHFPTA